MSPARRANNEPRIRYLRRRRLPRIDTKEAADDTDILLWICCELRVRDIWAQAVGGYSALLRSLGFGVRFT